MIVRVEFFGIPRERAGVPAVEISDSRASLALGDLLLLLAERYPRLAAACFETCALRPEYAANLHGRQFVRDPATPLTDGMTVLILSADAGG